MCSFFEMHGIPLCVYMPECHHPFIRSWEFLDILSVTMNIGVHIFFRISVFVFESVDAKKLCLWVI